MPKGLVFKAWRHSLFAKGHHSENNISKILLTSSAQTYWKLKTKAIFSSKNANSFIASQYKIKLYSLQITWYYLAHFKK